MSRHMVAAEDLGGVAEVAGLKNVGRSTVVQWAVRRARTGFPEPVAMLAMGPVYDLMEVRNWEPPKRGSA